MAVLYDKDRIRFFGLGYTKFGGQALYAYKYGPQADRFINELTPGTNDGILKASYCGYMDGVCKLTFASMPADVYIYSYQGTSTLTLTVASKQITGTAGTVYNLVLKRADGSIWAWLPFSGSGAGCVYDVTGKNNHATLANVSLTSFWSQTQDNFHYNIRYGFSKGNVLLHEEAFDSATGVVLNAGWTVTGGELVSAGTAGSRAYIQTPEMNTQIWEGNLAKYQVDVTVTQRTSGTVFVWFGNVLFGSISATGSFSFTGVANITSNVNGSLNFYSNPFVGKITYVKITRLSPVPAKSNGVADCIDHAITNPTGIWHNGAETKIQSTPLGLYAYGTALSNPKFKKTSGIKESKLLVFQSALAAGKVLDQVQNTFLP